MIDVQNLSDPLRDGVHALAHDMRTAGYQRHDPIREIFAMLGDRWTMLILLVLEIGTWRHADLRRVLAQLSAERSISQRVLTLKLRALERDGIVTRSITSDVPPRVSYALTEMGSDLTAKASDLLQWVRQRIDLVKAAREAFDALEN